MLLATAGPSALWYLTRATGAVTLILLTVSVVFGIANIARLQAAGWPRFVVEGLHRNVSLLALALLVVHIATTVLDPFAGIHLLDAFVPFVSNYRPLWLGLGAFASDLLIAIALTSVVRRRLGHTAWRATHWFAYLCWPVAVLHSVGTGSDVKQIWMLALTAACVVAVIAAVWARLGLGWPSRRNLRSGAFAASVALPAVFVIWLPGGPLAKDWARRAGTPLKDIPGAVTTNSATGGSSGSTSGSGAGATQVAAFTANVSGTVTQSNTSNGLTEVNIVLNVANPTLGTLDVRIDGAPTSGGGVQMTASSVAIGSAANPTLYSGSITSLSGTNIAAHVSETNGRSLALVMALQINPSTGTATGALQVTPA
jgi:sulfoxide reductase heme-binding subunit YedZ